MRSRFAATIGEDITADNDNVDEDGTIATALGVELILASLPTISEATTAAVIVVDDDDDDEVLGGNIVCESMTVSVDDVLIVVDVGCVVVDVVFVVVVAGLVSGISGVGWFCSIAIGLVDDDDAGDDDIPTDNAELA